MIYLLTAIALTAGGSSTVHIYIQTLHRTTQSAQTIHRTTQFTNLGRVRTVPCLCEVYLGICLTTEEKITEKPQYFIVLGSWLRGLKTGMTGTERLEREMRVLVPIYDII